VPYTVIVLGATTPPGRFLRLLDAAAKAPVSESTRVTLVNLADYRLGFADGRPPADRDDDAGQLHDLITRADAFVLGTPVYHGSFSGATKNLLDLLPEETLRGKPCGIVTMGTQLEHRLGASRHLRDVLAWFNAVIAPQDVYISATDFGADGAPLPEAVERITALLAWVDRYAAWTATEPA
jgi:FMN reductase